MGYESTAEPIKIGYLMDFLLPEGFPQTYFEDLTQPFDLVFKKGVEQGLIDRPIEIIYREVEGLPKGSVKAVIDAYGELCDEGVKEALERVKMMPAASGAPGTRVSFGNWTRRAWMGGGYLVARRLDADGVNSHLVDRFGEE